MAKVVTDTEHYEAIADIIRNLAEDTEQRKPSEMPDGIYKAYNVAYEKGKAEGGGDSFYDTFWDAYQNNGIRGNYEYAFSGEFVTAQISGWTDENFKPKYPIKPLKAQNMFNKTHIQKSPYLKSVDFSGCDAFIQCFYGSAIEELGVVDCRACQTGYPMTNVFASCTKLHTIEKFVPPRSAAAFNSTFDGCTALVNITVEGTIKQSISFVSSSLLSTGAEGETTNSVQSIINALLTITDGVARTITFHADVKAKLTDEQKATITQTKGWTLA